MAGGLLCLDVLKTSKRERERGGGGEKEDRLGRRQNNLALPAATWRDKKAKMVCTACLVAEEKQERDEEEKANLACSVPWR
jgi:hypothetical protein